MSERRRSACAWNGRAIGLKPILKSAGAWNKIVNLPARTTLRSGETKVDGQYGVDRHVVEALGLEYGDIEIQVRERFKNKPKLLG